MNEGVDHAERAWLAAMGPRLVGHRKAREWTPAALDALWRDPASADVLGTGDVAGIYRCLQSAGMTQRQIAAMVGQSQSEVSEIMAGRRVQAAAVLRRIAAGLRLPPDVLGLDRMCVCDVGWPAAPKVEVEATPTIVPLFWTGVEIRALRLALPMSVREFGNAMGVTARMVSKWDAGGAGIRPGAVNQTGLNYLLSRITPVQRARFSAWLCQDAGHSRPVAAR